MVALALVLVASLALLVLADDGPLVVDVGGWAAPVGIDLVADRLSALMLTISSAVTLCVLLYSLAQGNEDDEESAPVSIYHPTYLVLTAGVANAFLSGDLFNLYVGFEILLAASYVLITLGGTGERIRAGTIYIVVALLSSVLFLVAIAMIYAAHGHGEPGAAGPAPARDRPRRAAWSCRCCCCSRSPSRRPSSRCPRGCRTPTRPPRRP